MWAMTVTVTNVIDIGSMQVINFQLFILEDARRAQKQQSVRIITIVM